jgi:hypothetical protein
MLNDEIIRTLPPGARARKVFDEKGLYLFVTPTGGRFWRLKYRRRSASVKRMRRPPNHSLSRRFSSWR